MIRIIQLLCPHRHCIVATVYESDDGEEMPAKTVEFRAAFEAAPLNPWCGICGSKRLIYEDRPTRFPTMEEALPFLNQSSRDQMKTRAYIDRAIIDESKW